MVIAVQISLKTGHLPPRERFGFWHDSVCRGLLHVTPEPPATGELFQGHLNAYVAGRFQLADMRCTHGKIERTVGDLARGATDSVLLYAALGRHPQRYELGPHSYEMMPGDLCIVPMDRHYRGISGAVAFRSVLIPRSVIGPLMSRQELPRACHLGRTTPLARLLRASLDAAATNLPFLTETVGDAVLASLSGLAALALNASDEGRAAGRGALQEARLTALQAHMRRHLTDPMLDPGRAAAALGVSVRQVHLLFQPTGRSFSEWLLARRLEVCHAALTDPMVANRSVADIAFGQGFSSLSVFYRAFSAAYGVPPGGVRTAIQSRM